MKFFLEIELGSESMKTVLEVDKAIHVSLRSETESGRLLAPHEALACGEAGTVTDEHGNVVGRWRVKRDARTVADRVLKVTKGRTKRVPG